MWGYRTGEISIMSVTFHMFRRHRDIGCEKERKLWVEKGMVLL
jgi:hypothetical protein